MNHFLIDNSRENLITGAAYAASKEEGDRRVQILALEAHVLVRACAGGVHKTWFEEAVDWEDLARAKENPIPVLIDGLIFKLERSIAAKAES